MLSCPSFLRHQPLLAAFATNSLRAWGALVTAGPARVGGEPRRRAPRDGSTGPDGSCGPPRGLPAGPRLFRGFAKVNPSPTTGGPSVRNAGNLQPRDRSARERHACPRFEATTVAWAAPGSPGCTAAFGLLGQPSAAAAGSRGCQDRRVEPPGSVRTAVGSQPPQVTAGARRHGVDGRAHGGAEPARLD